MFVRGALLRIAKSKRLAGFFTSHAFGKRLARRFVAGETLEDAVQAVRILNARGISATLDHLGELSVTAGDAVAAAEAYHDTLDAIAREKLDANVSLKLTQLGLDIDETFCATQLLAVVGRASALGNFARVDMEGSAYTDRTLWIFQNVRAYYPNAVGAVIQAYLYRSENDIKNLCAAGCRVRLCKGAYREEPDVAFPKKRDMDANFLKLAKRLLASGIYHAIATHDEKMIRGVIAYARAASVSKTAFEFQMLYGIRRDLQQRLVDEGYHVRVYVPFGTEWFPYFMRRLAERPANLLFLLKHLF